MKVKLEHMVEEADGRLIAYVVLTRDDETPLKKVTVQGKNNEEITAEIRRKMQRFETRSADLEVKRAALAAAIDALNSEVAT